jgi:integrase
MASITRRGDYQYQAIIRRRGYPSQTKTFETRADAVKWARDIESKMDKRRFRDQREIESTTLSEALERYLATVTPTKKGLVAERNRIKQLQRHPIGLRPLNTLCSRDFAEYRDARLREVSRNSVRLELALFSHLYTVAIQEWSMPLEHELRNVRKPKAGEGRERRLAGDEEKRLRASVHRPEARSAAVWLEASIDLTIETGMRAGELLTLEWGQVNLQVGVIRLKETKNGSSRTVPLSHKAVDVLRALPSKLQARRVIPSFHDTSGLDRAFKRLCVAAGIHDLHFHDLRHEAASRLSPHMTVQTLAKIMGWKALQMAMRYYNPTDQELVDTVRRTLAA